MRAKELKENCVIVLCNKQEITNNTILYVIVKIIGITSIGTVELSIKPIGTVSDIYNDIAYPAVDAMSVELFLDQITVVGLIYNVFVAHAPALYTLNKANNKPYRPELENVTLSFDNEEEDEYMNRFFAESIVDSPRESKEFINAYRCSDNGEVAELYGIKENDVPVLAKMIINRYKVKRDA